MPKPSLIAALALLPLLGPADPPLPPVITPGDAPAAPPSDAIVLFDGTSADAWTMLHGKPCRWTLDSPPAKGGAMTCNPGQGSIVSTEHFGDVQLHVEFATPPQDAAAGKTGQERGNSGVYLQGHYEVQVLDSDKNDTYPDGQCGAIYKVAAPKVNACRPPGQWQTYDIIFHQPTYDAAGKKSANARLTVLHNGVLIQENVEVPGSTGSGEPEAPGPGPILLQDHGNLVKYRNIWARRL